MIKKIFIIVLALVIFNLSTKISFGQCVACGAEGVFVCSAGDLYVCRSNCLQWTRECGCGRCLNGTTCDDFACCTANGASCTSDDDCCSGYCTASKCAAEPTVTPMFSPTPTEVPCTSCGTPSQVCTYACQTCSGSLTNGYKNIKCWASQTCKTDGALACFTWNNVGAPATQCPNTCVGVTPIPSSAPVEPSCQVWTCWDMGTPQCSVGFPGCSGGVGYCDNCGTDCGTCSGAPPGGSTPVPTLPACSENCFDPIISPCTTTTCYNENCLGNCNQWCRGTKTNDCACAANLCSSQTCVGSCGDNCTGLLNCAPTTLNRFEIRRWDSIWSYTDSNVNGRDITDAQNRLHICDPFLSDESPHPRSVVYVAWLNNLNGCGDIDPNSVKMKWLGNNAEIAMTKLASYQSGPCAYTATVTYPTDTNIPSAQGFQITMKSISGGVTTDWTTVTPDLKLKVWNCQVPVSGTLYDGSSGQVCPDGGFTTLGNELGFSSLVFDSSSDDITATITSPSSYAGVNLIWAKSYLPLINGGIPAGNIDGNLQGSNRVTRVTDLGTGQRLCTSSQIDLWNGQVSPYSASPMAQIDFSFIADQEAWYQMVGAGVKSRILLQYGVPVTVLPETSKFLTLGDATRDNGLVSATNFLNINGNNLKDDMGSPNNWYIQQNTNDYDIYNYNYFYNNFYVKAGVGEILTDWSNAEPDNIYFVNGNLNINSNSPVVDPNTQTMIIIVRENITIQSNVTQLDGIYIADGSITAIGDNSAPLTINGMLYAGGSVGLYRSFTDKTVNNTTPAVKVNYSPGLIFNLPPEIMRVLSGWREE